MNLLRTARGLGWFSIALGLAEVVATKKISKAIQLERRPGLLRTFGFREIATGVGILTQKKRRAPWLWARVAGDVMDLAAIGTALVKGKGKRGKVAAAAAAVAGVTALDFMCGRRLGKA
jgi:hypothetical protein